MYNISLGNQNQKKQLQMIQNFYRTNRKVIISQSSSCLLLCRLHSAGELQEWVEIEHHNLCCINIRLETIGTNFLTQRIGSSSCDDDTKPDAMATNPKIVSGVYGNWKFIDSIQLLMNKKLVPFQTVLTFPGSRILPVSSVHSSRWVEWQTDPPFGPS